MTGSKRVLTFFLISSLFIITGSCMSKVPPAQRKAEKEQARKEKEARKEYEKALKQHTKNQSKETREMMKKTKKEAPGNTPLKKK
jgi:hypothetical protein